MSIYIKGVFSVEFRNREVPVAEAVQECKNSPERILLKRLLMSMEDDLRVEVLKTLAEPRVDGLSFRGLQRRLRVNHQRLERALSSLSIYGIVDVSNVKVENRVYRMFRLGNEVKELINSVLRCS
ncbi:MAG: hypothetical protein ABDH61_02055 [Acidilobaceae archaeon]